MKILCVSDQIDPLIYTSTIKQRYADTDVVLSAGDLPMDYLDFIMSTLNKPLLFVFGNHHTGDYSMGGACVDGKIRYEEGLIIAGLGGSMRYNRGDNQFSEFEMCMRALKMLPALFINRIIRGRFLDILLTHAAPRGIHDREDRCHLGFKGFLRFMRIFKPKYLIHGHTHLYDLSEVRTTKYCQTVVINAFSHYLIETGEKHESGKS